MATGSSSTSGASPRGLVNQGWKDSRDAIRDRDGTRGRAPVALAEVQGYVFDAKRRMAAPGRGCAARSSSPTRLDREAEAAAQRASRTRSGSRTRATTRWRSTGRSGQADAIGSNAGQCLWSGIVSPERAARRRRRLLGRSCSRAGASGPTPGPAGLQPDRLPHGHGLAPRHVAHRRRPQALRLP